MTAYLGGGTKIAATRSFPHVAFLTFGFLVSLCIFLLSSPFQDASSYLLPNKRPPPPPPTQQHENKPIDYRLPLDSCDPYSRPGHLYLNKSDAWSTYYKSYDSTCQPLQTSWIYSITLAVRHNTPLPELSNKLVLILGDSVDRNIVIDACSTLGFPATSHPLDTYNTTLDDENGGLPRSCFIPHLNLTLASYFFYGYDEQDMWTDKTNTYFPPGEYSARWGLFTRAVQTLPQKPDLVMVNMGLWELARFDRLLERAGLPDPDPPAISPEFLSSFERHTLHFLAQVRRVVGDQAKIRWRQMHTPTVSDGPFFKDKSGVDKPNRQRFDRVKIRVLNQVSELVLQKHSQAEVQRRSEEHCDGGEEDGRVTMWKVGDIVAPWKTGDWLRDDVHPLQTQGTMIWGNGVLEYLSRTPKKASDS